MQNLLQRPSIDEVLKGKSGTLITKKQAFERSKLRAAFHSKDEAQNLVKNWQAKVTVNKIKLDSYIKDQHKQI